MVGPEGGLTDQEILFALDSQFSAVTLGPRVLRTETAALAFISAIQSKFGDFQ
jgi:16S rRNA (uracil1498-N3)-methyltransferase